jgi:hypothetical protein
MANIIELLKKALPYILTAAIILLGVTIIYLIVVPPGALTSVTTAVT